VDCPRAARIRVVLGRFTTVVLPLVADDRTRQLRALSFAKNESSYACAAALSFQYMSRIRSPGHRVEYVLRLAVGSPGVQPKPASNLQ